MEHAPDLGNGHVRFVDHDQPVVHVPRRHRSEVVQQAECPAAAFPAIEEARVVLDPRAVPDLANHLEVVTGPTQQPLRLQELALPLQGDHGPVEFLADLVECLVPLVLGHHVVHGREDVDVLLLREQFAGHRVEQLQAVDLIAEEIDSHAVLLVGGVDLDAVALHPEVASFRPERGNFRVKGDCIEVYPAYEQYGMRIDLFGDEIDSLQLFDPVTGELLAEEQNVYIFPAVHYVMPEDQRDQALDEIREELDRTVISLKGEGKLLEAQRLLGRTRYDLEMIREVGYCSGIENYARFFDRRERGSRAFCLLDYFRAMPARDVNDWLVMIDESHVTIPQIRGMFHGDQARKRTLVEHGFRLPSALDNRPITLDEFEEIIPRAIYVSATPAAYELEKSEGQVVEQVIRPTGLVDPPIEIKPARGQVPDLVAETRKRAERGERVLVTALTKKLCEDLAHYLEKEGLRVRYLHSEIDTLDRLDILADLRSGSFDVLVGVNLLREGLDLPEVSLVCILDADKQGFLRSQSSLIQTMGRAARNANSEAILYADTVTEQMQNAIDEVERRRKLQLAYNAEHGITPTTITKAIRRGIEQELSAHRTAIEAVGKRDESQVELDDRIKQLEEDMLKAADDLDFERAAELRDRIDELANPDAASSEPAKTKAGTPGSRAGRTGRKRRG